MKSDILRYEILYRFGGVYVDTDYECVGSLDALILNCNLFAGFSHTEVLEINNGILGCVPKDALMSLLINEISKHNSVKKVIQNNTLAFSIAMFVGNQSVGHVVESTAPHSLKACDTISQTGPGLLTRVLCQYLSTSLNPANTSSCDGTVPNSSGCERTESSKSCCSSNGDDEENHSIKNISDSRNRILLLPVDVFHPVPNTCRVQLDDGDNEQIKGLKDEFLRHNTIAIHWWQRSWI